MASQTTPEDNSWHIFDKVWNLNSKLLNCSKQVGNSIKSTANAAENKWKESSTITKACIIGSTTAAVAPLAILPVLGAAGFTSAGVVAGSWAAYMQTATTVSGSVFALCQSAAATGAVAVSTSVGVGLGAGATASGITAAVCRKKPDNQNNDNNEQVRTEEENNGQEAHDEQYTASEENEIQVSVDPV